MGDSNVRPCSHLNERDLADLQKSGLSAEQAAIAGHFSVDRDRARELVGYKLPGLIFQYSGIDRKPFLRTDGKPYYRIKPQWGRLQTEDSPKYLSPKKQGCRPYFSQLYPNWRKAAQSTKVDLWETEGEKKADCGCMHGLAVIGFSGVDGWQDRCDRATGEKLSQSRVLPELSCITWQNRRVNQCFDSDIIEKTQVQLALAKRARHLQKTGALPYLVLLPNEIDGTKNGLDDFVVRHGIEALQILANVAEPTPIKVKVEGKGEEKTEQVWLDLREPESHGKAVLAWTVLKEHWAFRVGIGWYEWRRTHWKLKSEEEFEAILTKFMDAQKWKKRSSGIITSVVRELRSRLLIKEEDWQPFNKIAFANGTLDLASNKFTDNHNPEDHLTQLRPFDFNLTVSCPYWLSFLDDAMRGDQRLVSLIQAIFRYSVLPQNKDQKFEIEKSFDFFGPKGSGKGTTLEILTSLVGMENIGPAEVDTFKDAVGLGQLIDKTMAIAYDASGFLGNVGFYNRVVSNEPVPVKKLYQDSYTTRLGVVVIRAYNTFIGVPDGSEGLDRRITVVPFMNRPKVVDEALSSKLKTELSGIFAWCYSLSYQEMKTRILTAGRIPAIAEACSERFEANNPEIRFLTEKFPYGAESIKAGVLYQQYKEWCGENGHQLKSQVKFRPAIELLGCKRSGKTNGCYFYSIPRMEDFDIGGYIGIVQEGRTGQGEVEDSSNLDGRPDRDSCRGLEIDNAQELNKTKNQVEGEVEKGERTQLSTTISNPDLTASLDHPEISPSLPSIYSEQNIKVGDRVCYIGEHYTEQLANLELFVHSINENYWASCQKPDGYLTTWLPHEDLKRY